jgi:exosortase/archaeosortase family protein
MILIVAWFLIFPKALDTNMALFIWIISGAAVLYRAKTSGKIGRSEMYKKFIIIIGIFISILSFIAIPLGLSNPPYSIGELSILLVGITFIIFAFLEFKPLLLPGIFPLIAVLGYQIFGLLIENIETIAAPLISPVVVIIVFTLNLLGLNASSFGDNITFLTREGLPMNVSIVVDCTGIWSLGAFTIALLAVLSVFPKTLSRKSLLWIVIGYVGVYIANLIRVLLICLSGYFYGHSGVTQMMHVELGWVAFSIWMMIFWYLFFSRYLLKEDKG